MSSAIPHLMNRFVNGKTTVAVLMTCLVILCLPLHCAGQDAGQVKFVNSCKYNLTLLSNGKQLARLDPGGQKSVAISSFTAGAAYNIIAYPNLTDTQCPANYCDKWTALGGAPGTTQREGWMWEGDNAKFAAYCNPSLSGFGICAAQKNCCGTGMVQDGGFGTYWEFTPNGGGGNDYPDLSTNYGSGPHSPPKLCGPGVDPNDCVAKAANILFNVPLAWTTNINCITNGNSITGAQCFTASCSDAYQHPTDNKQVACPVNPKRGYVVTYCPAGSSMPDP